MHPAQNSGGYPIFEPECILLKIRVGTNFRPMVPEWMVRGASAHPSKTDYFLASAHSAGPIYNGTFCHFALPSYTGYCDYTGCNTMLPSARHTLDQQPRPPH